MNFNIKKYATDLGTTNIENRFILNQLFEASGDYVKVYLLLQYLAQNSIDSDITKFERILNLNASEIKEALEYWQIIGLIHISGDSIEIASLNAIYAEQIQAGSAYRGFDGQTADNMDSFFSQNSSPDFSLTLHRCEDMLGREILTKQRMEILHIVDSYKLDYTIVEKSFSYTSTKGISEPNYAIKTLRAWADKGYKTAEHVEEHEGVISEREKFFKSIYKSIGIVGRSVSKADREVMESWLDKLGFSTELIALAIDNAVLKTTNPNFSFLNAVMLSLSKNNVHDVESFHEYIKTKTSDKASKYSSDKKSNKVSESNGYTNEELESILLANKKK